MKKSTLGVFVENIKYVVYQEGKFFVSLCLNAEVSSFGESVEEAIANLKEAVELYFDDSDAPFNHIGNTMVGEVAISV